MRNLMMRAPWLMIVVMVAVTIWSATDGGQSTAMVVVASIGTIAAMMVLALVASALPDTRLVNAAFSGIWIVLFVPVWDWLEGQYAYPESIVSALVFGGGFGFLRYLLSPPDKSSRPPS